MMKKLKFVRYLPTRIKLMKQMKSIAKAEGATAFMGPLFEKSKQTPLKKLKSGTNKIVVKTVHFGFQPMIMEKDVRVPVRDGVCLLVNVFRPEKEGRYPVVLSADVYGKDPFFYPGQTSTTPALSGIGGVSTSMYTPFESPDPGFWVPNDYVLVKMAMRGTSDSDGDIAPFFSDVEAQDYADVINWAGTQPWSNGNVGTNGVSYLAVTQWQVAQLNAKHHKAMIPWEGFNDMYRDLVTHGGIPESLLVQFWSKIVTMKWPDKACEDVNAVLRAHPLYDEYWESKAAVLSKIKVPMLVGASWSTQGLHCRGSLEGFKQSSSELKWLYIHGRKEWEHYYQRENLERQKRFFDYFLKERKDNGWIDTPRVMVDVRERFFDGHFRYENEWPIARTQYTPLYLDAETSSLNISPVVKESKASYNSKNKSAEKNGQARFNITFDTETELTGHMKLKLWVATDGSDDMDLFIGIRKFDKHGKEVCFPGLNHREGGPVTIGWLRVSHRELDLNRSTPYQPWLKHEREMKLKKGEIVPVEIEILASSTLFRAKEALQVVIQGSDISFRPTDALPANHGSAPAQHSNTVNAGMHYIHTGGQYDSHLLMPVVPQKG